MLQAHLHLPTLTSGRVVLSVVDIFPGIIFDIIFTFWPTAVELAGLRHLRLLGYHYFPST